MGFDEHKPAAALPSKGPGVVSIGGTGIKQLGGVGRCGEMLLAEDT